MVYKDVHQILNNDWKKYDAYPLNEIREVFKYYYQVLGNELYDYGKKHPDYVEIKELRGKIHMVVEKIREEIYITDRSILESEVRHLIKENIQGS